MMSPSSSSSSLIIQSTLSYILTGRDIRHDDEEVSWRDWSRRDKRKKDHQDNVRCETNLHHRKMSNFLSLDKENKKKQEVKWTHSNPLFSILIHFLPSLLLLNLFLSVIILPLTLFLELSSSFSASSFRSSSDILVPLDQKEYKREEVVMMLRMSLSDKEKNISNFISF